MVKLLWLADVLRNAEQKVVEVKGWRTRGGQMGEIKGVLLHHTAGRKDGNMPSLGVITSGRSGLSGPLAQLGLGRDGTWYVVAAGRANHAGKGKWKGLVSGNLHLIGVEAENTGLANDMPWPQVQYDAYAEGVGAILDFLNLPAYCAIGHREWAPKRKIDPTFDMVEFRGKVENIMSNEKKKSLVRENKPWPEIVEIDPPEPELGTFDIHDHEQEPGEEPVKYEDWETPPRKPEPVGEAEHSPWLIPRPEEETKYVPDLPKEEVEATFEPWIDPVVVKIQEEAKEVKRTRELTEEESILAEAGWKDYQIAALLAQAKVETDSNPNHATYAINKRPTPKENPNAEIYTFGMMNWDKARLYNLDNFVEWYNKENGTELKRSDKEAQVRFVDWELRNIEKPAFKQLSESKGLDEALRGAVSYIRPSKWSEDTPENSDKWKERVFAAYELMDK